MAKKKAAQPAISQTDIVIEAIEALAFKKPGKDAGADKYKPLYDWIEEKYGLREDGKSWIKNMSLSYPAALKKMAKGLPAAPAIPLAMNKPLKEAFPHGANSEPRPDAYAILEAAKKVGGIDRLIEGAEALKKLL